MMLVKFSVSRSVCAAALGLLIPLVPAGAELAPRTAAAPVSQAAPPPKPLDFEAGMKALQTLEGLSRTLEEQKFGYNAKIIKELREAGATSDKAFALWLDCRKNLDFDQQGKTMAEYSEWKRGQTKEANRERDTGLQMQVQWLAIVLMEANARTEAARAETVAAAVQFLETLVERVQKVDGNLGEAGGQSVLGSVFARHYKLESTVSGRDGGAYVPGDAGAIYEKMILPYYRETKQAVNLMNAWKRRIEQETLIASSGKARESRDRFETVRLPELKWGQAVELFQLGQEEPAAGVMLSIIKANMTHRSAGQWISQFKTLLDRKDPAKGKPVPAERAAEPEGAEPAAPAGDDLSWMEGEPATAGKPEEAPAPENTAVPEKEKPVPEKVKPAPGKPFPVLPGRL